MTDSDCGTFAVYENDHARRTGTDTWNNSRMMERDKDTVNVATTTLGPIQSTLTNGRNGPPNVDQKRKRADGSPDNTEPTHNDITVEVSPKNVIEAGTAVQAHLAQ